MKKKIWIMNHYATNQLLDQAGRHYWFAKYLKQTGYEPVVFSCNTKHGEVGNYFNDSALWQVQVAPDGFSFVVIRSTPGTGNGIRRVRNMVTFARNLKRAAKMYAVEAGKPDVVIASSVHPFTMVAGLQIAKKFNVPCICEIRDLWPEAIFAFTKLRQDSMIGRIFTAGEYWIYRRAHALVFTKEGDVDYLIEQKWDTDQGGRIDLRKCYYINNGVNLEQYDRQIQVAVFNDEDLQQPGAFNVVYAGTIRPVNNIGFLLDCAALLQEYKSIRFLVFGSGSELEALRTRVRQERLQNVKFKGFVERKYLPNILSNSSVNVLNYSQTKYNWSRGNSSNKLFEYMASGKPIISTVRMGYSIINRYQCGVEIDQNTPQSLAEAILKIYHMPTVVYDKLSQNARKGAEDFDFPVLTEKLIRVIESVLPDGDAKANVDA